MPAEPVAELINTLVGFGVPVLLILLGLVAGRTAERRHFRSLDRRERDLAGMNATDVRTYLGGAEPSRHAALVTAEVVIANDYLKSLLSALRKIVGGELRSYGSLMLRARREALLRLKEKARRLGHNAICNVRYETADIGGMARKGGGGDGRGLRERHGLHHPGGPELVSGPSKDPSVFDEPHLHKKRPKLDPSEARAERALERSRRKGDSEDERVEHGVRDEPTFSPELAAGAPTGATYSGWLESRRAGVGAVRPWAVTALVALAAGPWAVLGAFMGSGETAFSVLAIIVFGPVAEEMMKIAAATYVVEKRPYLFTTSAQIIIAALAGGLAFGALENLLYLNTYIPDPEPGMIRWRWTVCVAMHAGCSLVAALGLVRIWRDAWRRTGRPRLTLGYPYLVTAIAIHGAYNVFAVALHLAHYRF